MLKNTAISKLSDEELLSSYKESSKKNYISELFNRYLPFLYGVCLKYLKDVDKAQDAVLQLYKSLLHSIAYYEIDVFRQWIYSVTKNHCLQILRNEEHFIEVDFDDNDEETDKIFSILEDDNKEQTTILMDCLMKLPEKQRVSITYFYLDALSYAEIVDKTGYTLKNVKNYIQNGKRNLLICLEKNDL